MTRITPALLIGSTVVILVAAVSQADPEPTPAAPSPGTAAPQSVDEARRQAEVLHSTIHIALQLVHDRYYREDEGLPIPAAILSELFAELEKEQQVTLRWLAVEGQAMNADHTAQNEFEERAVTALKARRPFLEDVSDGTYRRAGPITLSNHCLKCHVPNRRSLEDRSAGLIIQIPLQAANGE